MLRVIYRPGVRCRKTNYLSVNLQSATGDQTGGSHRIGQQENEPQCLIEGVRRVVSGEAQLHFHRVVAMGR